MEVISNLLSILASIFQLKDSYDKRREKEKENNSKTFQEPKKAKTQLTFQPPPGWEEEVKKGFAQAKKDLKKQGRLATKANNKKRILLVEDEKITLESTVELLEILGNYEVIQARNGEEALKRLEKEMPDLIICDVVMPKMDGFEFTKIVRQTTQVNWIPIILISGQRCEDIDKTMGLSAGAVAYMNKPFRADKFLAQIKTLLEQTELLMNRNKSDESVLQGFT